MHLHHKERWVFSPLLIIDGKEIPLVHEYSLLYEAPMHYNGFALVHCVMNAHQLAAAKQNPHLVILPSTHCREAIPNELADHHESHGLKRGMLIHEALQELAKYHPNFEPEH
jgi:hypothetical protein